jgi:hypothetical protein
VGKVTKVLVRVISKPDRKVVRKFIINSHITRDNTEPGDSLIVGSVGNIELYKVIAVFKIKEYEGVMVDVWQPEGNVNVSVLEQEVDLP